MADPYVIGQLTLHPHRELLDGGKPVVIGRRALDLLSLLAAADGGVVTKDELLKGVWRNTIVEENALQAQIHAARKVLGIETERLITVHGRGYRLLLDGTASANTDGETSDRAATDAPASPVYTDVANAAHKPGLRSWTRRGAAGAALVAGAAAITGLGLWARSDRHKPNPRALELYRHGKVLEQDSDFPPPRGQDPSPRLVRAGGADRSRVRRCVGRACPESSARTAHLGSAVRRSWLGPGSCHARAEARP